MPAARPSQAAVSNVLSAMAEHGIVAQSIQIDADGGFVVQISTPVLTAPVSVAAQTVVEEQPPAYE